MGVGFQTAKCFAARRGAFYTRGIYLSQSETVQGASARHSGYLLSVVSDPTRLTQHFPNMFYTVRISFFYLQTMLWGRCVSCVVVENKGPVYTVNTAFFSFPT